MLDGHHSMREDIKSHSIRKVENHCPRVFEFSRKEIDEDMEGARTVGDRKSNSWSISSHVGGCSMNNKNPETDIGVQPEDQKSKAASHWLLPLRQSEMAILPPGISEWDCVWELSPPVLYSALGLGLRVCTTTASASMATGVATGIKGVCLHCLVCKAD